MGSQRVLFLEHEISGGLACFDNGAKGGNPSTIVGYLAEKLRCRGMACSSIPNTLTGADTAKPGTWGGVKFTLFAPERRELLNIERTISVNNDVGGWEFNTMGSAQGFEQIERYSARRIAERFTPEMLEEYGRALGLELFDDAFYGGAGLITHAAPWFLRKLPTTTLADARRQLGLDD